MRCNICKSKNIKTLNYFGKIPRSYDFKKNNIIKKYKLIDLLIKHIKNDRVSGFHFKGIWHDVGNEERLTEVKNLFFKD